jgi:hypothetical protein
LSVYIPGTHSVVWFVFYFIFYHYFIPWARWHMKGFKNVLDSHSCGRYAPVWALPLTLVKDMINIPLWKIVFLALREFLQSILGKISTFISINIPFICLPN